MAANFDMRKGRVQVEWFRGAKTNVCYNALDRWVAAGRGQQVTPVPDSLCQRMLRCQSI